MIDIEARCEAIPEEYRAAAEEERVNLKLEIMSYLNYNKDAAVTCRRQLRAYDTSIVSPRSGAAA
jgi:hypothetical protein